MTRGARTWRLSRDTVLFIGGMAGIAHETLIYKGQTRAELLIVFAGMMGLPAFLHQDDKKGERKNNNDAAAK